MLAGFCGTLMTPMAANFNIVPAALLELPDENAVIRAQIPTALLLLGCNIAAHVLLRVPLKTGDNAADAGDGGEIRRRRAGPRDARIPATSSITSLNDAGELKSPRAAASDFLRELRLAFVRARLLAAGDDAQTVSIAIASRRQIVSVFERTAHGLERRGRSRVSARSRCERRSSGPTAGRGC